MYNKNYYGTIFDTGLCILISKAKCKEKLL